MTDSPQTPVGTLTAEEMERSINYPADFIDMIKYIEALDYFLVKCKPDPEWRNDIKAYREDMIKTATNTLIRDMGWWEILPYEQETGSHYVHPNTHLK